MCFSWLQVYNRRAVFFKIRKTATTISFLRAYKRVLAFLVLGYSVFRVVHPDEDGRFLDLFFIAILVMLIASQIFWICRALDLGERFIPGKPRRAWLAVIACVVYLFFFVYSFTHSGVVHMATIGHTIGVADPRLRGVLMEGAFT